jgi:hypothetical protein
VKLALDLNRTTNQIFDMVVETKDKSGLLQSRLNFVYEELLKFDYQKFIDKKSKLSNAWPWPIPEFPETPANSIPVIRNPDNYIAIGVDGSHIDVNRHIPLKCFLINIGVAKLTYGNMSDAILSSSPTLYHGHSEIVIKDPNKSYRDVPLQGTLLGAFRTVKEIEELAHFMELNSDVPTIGLVDGTLVLLDVLRSHIPQFVVDHLLNDGFLTALSKIKDIKRESPTLLASYISLPSSKECINGANFYISDSIEDFHIDENVTYDILDRQLFSLILKDRERSELFSSSSPAVKSYYGIHHVMFFYVNTGDEIARVEIPHWIAENPSNIDLIHSLILDQCDKGPTYPTVLMEAHEQAVISSKDREYFLNMIETNLEYEDIAFYTSQKDRSKRLRWL